MHLSTVLGKEWRFRHSSPLSEGEPSADLGEHRLFRADGITNDVAADLEGITDMVTNAKAEQGIQPVSGADIGQLIAKFGSGKGFPLIQMPTGFTAKTEGVKGLGLGSKLIAGRRIGKPCKARELSAGGSLVAEAPTDEAGDIDGIERPQTGQIHRRTDSIRVEIAAVWSRSTRRNRYIVVGVLDAGIQGEIRRENKADIWTNNKTMTVATDGKTAEIDVRVDITGRKTDQQPVIGRIIESAKAGPVTRLRPACRVIDAGIVERAIDPSAERHGLSAASQPLPPAGSPLLPFSQSNDDNTADPLGVDQHRRLCYNRQDRLTDSPQGRCLSAEKR